MLFRHTATSHTGQLNCMLVRWGASILIIICREEWAVWGEGSWGRVWLLLSLLLCPIPSLPASCLCRIINYHVISPLPRTKLSNPCHVHLPQSRDRQPWALTLQLPQESLFRKMSHTHSPVLNSLGWCLHRAQRGGGKTH